WGPLIARFERRFSGCWIAPDLRGHGRSPRAASYALDEHAADVAALVKRLAPRAAKIAVLGHSMGGAIALALACGAYGFAPTHALGLGVKIRWSEAEAAALKARAAAPAKSFPSRQAAIGFYLKVSGLAGLAGADEAMAEAGVAAAGDCLAADSATAAVGAPAMDRLVAAARAPFHLGAGENDAMSRLEHMAAYDAKAVLIAGAGHNAMVEAPERVLAWAEAVAPDAFN